jgi:hypothetical protein
MPDFVDAARSRRRVLEGFHVVGTPYPTRPGSPEGGTDRECTATVGTRRYRAGTRQIQRAADETSQDSPRTDGHVRRPPAADRNPVTFADVPGGLALTSCLRCGAVVRTVHHDEWHTQVGAYWAAPFLVVLATTALAPAAVVLSSSCPAAALRLEGSVSLSVSRSSFGVCNPRCRTRPRRWTRSPAALCGRDGRVRRGRRCWSAARHPRRPDRR